MLQLPFALQFLVVIASGWVNRRQQLAIEYLLEENRVLREQLGSRRLRIGHIKHVIGRRADGRGVIDLSAVRGMTNHAYLSELRQSFEAAELARLQVADALHLNQRLRALCALCAHRPKTGRFGPVFRGGNTASY